MALTRENGKHNGKTLTTQQSVNSLVRSIGDIRHRSNCARAIGFLEYY